MLAEEIYSFTGKGNLEVSNKNGVEVSPVWEHAKKVDGGAQCTICPKMIKGGNTSNIRAHILKKHPFNAAAKKLKADIDSKKEKDKLKKGPKADDKSTTKSSIMNINNQESSIAAVKETLLEKTIIDIFSSY